MEVDGVAWERMSAIGFCWTVPGREKLRGGDAIPIPLFGDPGEARPPFGEVYDGGEAEVLEGGEVAAAGKILNWERGRTLVLAEGAMIEIGRASCRERVF